MSGDSIFADPRDVHDLDECYFYHTMDIPGYGLVEGEWDLRHREAEYLGGVDFQGKRVLEVGTASGGLCFAMEAAGADVISYDLSEAQVWDIVPFSRADRDAEAQSSKEHIRKINNGYWLAHRAFESKAKVAYGSVYEIPKEIGAVDIAVLGCVLLHVRDPFLAMQNALAFAKDTAVVIEAYRPSRWTRLLEKLGLASAVPRPRATPRQTFIPDFQKGQSAELWWYLPPETIVNYMGVLGFEDVEVRFHTQQHWGKNSRLYTAVGKRTSPRPPD